MQLLTLVVGPLQANCYTLWTDPGQAAVIDPGDEGARIVEALRDEGVTPQLILNTHGHFDHTGAVEHLKNAFGATYRIHAADVPIMQMVPARTRLFGVLTGEVPMPSDYVEPDQVFRLRDLEIQAIHTPGHTPGGTCYYLPKEGAVFTGDTLFLGTVGRSDFPGGDGPLLVRSIKERLLSLPPDTKVYPGHGPPTTIRDEAEGNPFLA